MVGRTGLAGGLPVKQPEALSEKGNAPEWQPMDRVLEAFRLSQDRRGRKAYVAWLEARAENEGGKIEAGTSVKKDWLASRLRMGHPEADPKVRPPGN